MAINCSSEQISSEHCLSFIGQDLTPYRPLWIDAICLNQASEEEKKNQVPLMGKIYKSATRTLIWLGEAVDNSSLAMRSLNHLAQKLSDLNARQTVFTVAGLESLPTQGLPPRDDPVWKALEKLLMRPWFFRLWTLQEIVLSREPVVLCGDEFNSWEDLPLLTRSAINTETSTLIMPVSDAESLDSNSITFLHQIEGMRTRMRPLSGAMNLPAVVQLSKGRLYQEPVDRFWAILGLLGEAVQMILREANIIDYSSAARINYQETYLSVLIAHINFDIYGAMQVLAMQLMAGGLSQERNPQLPSWCPDWHRRELAYPIARMPGVAAGKLVSMLLPRIYLHGRTSLNVLGIPVQVVKVKSNETGRFWVEYIDTTAEDFAPYLLRLQRSHSWAIRCLKISKGIPESGPSNHYRPEEADISLMPNDVDAMIALWQNFIESSTALTGVLFPQAIPNTRDLSSLCIWCNGRRFFRTTSGSIGLGPADLQPGDMICSILGANPLFVLRRSTQQSSDMENSEQNLYSDGEESFQVIGDAYMPGFMNGEAFQIKRMEFMRYFKLV